MEGKIKSIVDKVRQMYKYCSDYSAVLKQKARVQMKENDSGEIELFSITFSDGYDRITIYDTEIDYIPENTTAKKLIEYESFEDLLNL